MFSGDHRKESLETFLRGGGIVLAAFIVTLMIFLLCQQFMQNARGRFKNLMTEAGAEERRISNPAAGQAMGYSPLNPNMPRLTAGYVPPRSMSSYTPVIPQPARPYTPSDIFSTNEEHDQAVTALESLRIAVQTVRQYDSSSFWQPIPKADMGTVATEANGPNNEAVPLGPSPNGDTSDETPTRLYAATSGGLAAQRQKVITRISNETDALHTELSIVAHPDLFPEQVRNLAKTVGLEARIYLSTVQLSLSRPDERTEMQSLAREHLNRSEAALRELERATGSFSRQGASGGLAN